MVLRLTVSNKLWTVFLNDRQTLKAKDLLNLAPVTRTTI